jgi:hypothetical protein
VVVGPGSGRARRRPAGTRGDASEGSPQQPVFYQPSRPTSVRPTPQPGRDDTSKTKRKQPAGRDATARAGQHRRHASRSTSRIPLLPAGALAVLLVLCAGVAYLYFTTAPSGPQKVANINCDATEQVANHYHAHLSILYNGNEVNVPANTGIVGTTCLYWMHTHDTTGVIHIEAPKSQANRAFTLGDFFAIWGQPLSKTQVATLKVTGDQKLLVYVDGTLLPDQDPSKIVLKAHTQVVLEFTPPTVDPPPTYTFPSGL